MEKQKFRKVLPVLFYLFHFLGRESKARELMSLPWININAQYANGNTPLILAIQGKPTDL